MIGALIESRLGRRSIIAAAALTACGMRGAAAWERKPDHVVGAGEQACGPGEAEAARGAQVDREDEAVREGMRDLGQFGTYELGVKRVEVLRDAFPAARRLAVLYIDSRGGLAELGAIRTAAARLNFEALAFRVITGAELAPAFEDAARAGAEALMHINTPVYRFLRDTIIALAARYRLPMIHDDAESVEAGGLMSYASDRRLTERIIAAPIDRVLKGAKPADIPVELPTRFELVINLKTARELGITIPPALVALADLVSE